MTQNYIGKAEDYMSEGAIREFYASEEGRRIPDEAMATSWIVGSAQKRRPSQPPKERMTWDY